MTDNPPEEFEILPSGEMQEKYGLYAESRPKITLEVNQVPASLHDLIPLAETYGVRDDIRRHDLGDKTTDADKQKLSTTLKGRHPAIYRWLRDAPQPLSTEAYHFMLLCIFELEECRGPGIPGGNPSDEEIDQWYHSFLTRRYGSAK